MKDIITSILSANSAAQLNQHLENMEKISPDLSDDGLQMFAEYCVKQKELNTAIKNSRVTSFGISRKSVNGLLIELYFEDGNKIKCYPELA